MKTKLMPRLANAALLMAAITISGLVGAAQEVDRPVDLNTGSVQLVTFDVLNDEVINRVEISSDVEVDESFIALDYWRIFFNLGNTIIDLEYIQPIGDLDIGRTINV